MSNPISILEQIQRIDLEINAIEEEEKGYRRDLERVSQEIQSIEEKLKELNGALGELNESVKERELRITESGEKIKRDENRLNSIKNNKEYSALTKGINQAKKARKHNEQELASFMEKVEGKQSKIDELENTKKEKSEEQVRLSTELEQKLPQWEKFRLEKQELRESVAGDLAPEYLKRYETIKARRGGRGLVPARNETCLGCHMHIPPQMYIQLKLHTDELISCPHCHRLLYFDTTADTEVV